MFSDLFSGIGFTLVGGMTFVVNLIDKRWLGVSVGFLVLVCGLFFTYSALKDWGVL